MNTWTPEQTNTWTPEHITHEHSHEHSQHSGTPEHITTSHPSPASKLLTLTSRYPHWDGKFENSKYLSFSIVSVSTDVELSLAAGAEELVAKSSFDGLDDFFPLRLLRSWRSWSQTALWSWQQKDRQLNITSKRTALIAFSRKKKNSTQLIAWCHCVECVCLINVSVCWRGVDMHNVMLKALMWMRLCWCVEWLCWCVDFVDALRWCVWGLTLCLMQSTGKTSSQQHSFDTSNTPTTHQHNHQHNHQHINTVMSSTHQHINTSTQCHQHINSCPKTSLINTSRYRQHNTFNASAH